MQRKFIKKVKHWIGDILLNGLLTTIIPLLRLLKPKTLVSLSRVLGTVTFYLFRRYRKRVFQNLSLALGEDNNPRERVKLAKEVFFNFTLTPLEAVYAYIHPFERFLLNVEVQGKQYLDEALGRGKGVIALGAHLGPFTLVGGRLSLEGYRFNLMINEGNYPKLWKRLGDVQRRMGQNPFSLKPTVTAIKKSLNCLHRNEILYVIADEQQRRGGIPVPFFDRRASTAPGPAILSLKTGAPILPVFIVRKEGIPRTLVIGPPVEIERSPDMKKDIENLTATFTRVIEEKVRQYPGQWAWLNRRWKSPHFNGYL